jgi:uncharacterized protein
MLSWVRSSAEVSNPTTTRPQPVPDPVTLGFWEAAARGGLSIQFCADCEVYQHPPRPYCQACSGSSLRYEAVSGEGRLWSWSRCHHNVLPGLDAAVPFTCFLVELREQPGLLVAGDLMGREDLAEQFRIGMPMRLIHAARPAGGGSHECRLPMFEPVSDPPEHGQVEER